MKFIICSILLMSSAANAISLSDWKQLSKIKKINFLLQGSADVEVDIDKRKFTKNKLTLERQKLLNTQLKIIVKKLSEHQTELETDVEDDIHGIVGDVERTADVFISDDNHFLGAQIYFSQKGCAHQDENGEYIEQGGHYKTMTEAKKNKCFDEDVSWSGYSIIDEKFKEIDHSEYMEWSGY